MRASQTSGQAAVETALTFPMLLFAMLGILQLTLSQHARILSEYAAFKAARAGSIYRADCGRMKNAALTALAPSMSYTMVSQSADAVYAGAQVAPGVNMVRLYLETQSKIKFNRSSRMTPLVWVDYKLENFANRDFDLQLTGGEDVERIRVKLAYFFQYRIPFANWIMVRYWLATNRAFNWGQSDGSDSTMMVVKARNPGARANVDRELVNQAFMNMYMGIYTAPIVATWEMRMMSDPLAAATRASGTWKCK